VSPLVEEPIGPDETVRHHRERRPRRDAEDRLEHDRVGDVAGELHADLAQRRRPDRAVVVLRAGEVARVVVGHGAVAVDAAEAVAFGRIAAALRRGVEPAARVPVGDAEEIAAGGAAGVEVRGESPVIGGAFAQRTGLAAEAAAEGAGSDPLH
jgi:hypothetical protein